MPQTFHQVQMLQKTFLFEDGDALFLIAQDQQIIARMDVKNFPSIGWNHNLPFISHFYHAKNVLAFGRYFQPQILLIGFLIKTLTNSYQNQA